jgi:FkbH-like protein
MNNADSKKLLLYGDWHPDSLKLHFSKTFIQAWSLEIISRGFANYESILRDLETMDERPSVVYVDLSVSSLVSNAKDVTAEDEIRRRVRTLFAQATAHCDLFVMSLPALSDAGGLLSDDHVCAANAVNHTARWVIYEAVLQAVRTHKNAVAVNAQAKTAGPNLKQWVVQKSRYSASELKAQARGLEQLIERAYVKPVKLLVCDLDNTLWGGIIGDDGPQNLRLGGHDPIGEAYRLIQAKLRALKEKGLLLAISSKNDLATVEDFILNSPDMILRKADFVSIKCNWNSKVENMVEIAKDLNLSIDDFAFLDDSPAERAALEAQFPTMRVLENDGTPYSIFESLCLCAGLHPLAITSEDKLRSDFYLGEAKRLGLKSAAEDSFEWVKRLGIRAIVSRDFDEDSSRIVQLLNKTNQFNALTRRLTPAEMCDWVKSAKATCITIRAQDRYGDYGLIGFATFFVKDEVLVLVDFVFSCRAMGRSLEECLLLHVCEAGLAKNRARGIKSEFVETAKNKPAKLFYEKYGLLGATDKVVDIKGLHMRLRPMCKHIEMGGA